jgi:branched-chain amino acid transport system permease protein
MRAFRLLTDHWTLVVLLGLITLGSAIGLMGDEIVEREVTLALIYVAIVTSLFAFSGNSGVLSFGHISFMAIGAYTTGLLTLSPTLKQVVLTETPHWLQTASLPSLPAILLGGALAAGVALLLSIPLMRLSGLPAALATFAVLNIVYVVANNWKPITGGQVGLSGIPSNTTLGVALTWALLTTTVVYVFTRSRNGLRLRSSREDEVAARSIGVAVEAERRLAFVISAFFTGVAGGVYAQYIASFNAGSFYLTVTFLTVVMLVVGGMKSLSGAVVGTIFISSLSALLLRIEEGIDVAGISLSGKPGLRELVLAAVMLGVLILRPQGITGGREFTWPFGRRPIDRWGRRGAAPLDRPQTTSSKPLEEIR